MGAFSATARAPLYITVVRNRERQTAMAMAARCPNCAELRRQSRQRQTIASSSGADVAASAGLSSSKAMTTPRPPSWCDAAPVDRRRWDGQQRHRVDDPLGKIVSRRRHRQRVSGFADRLGVHFRLVWRRAAVSGYGGSMLELRGAASPITPATPELWRSPPART